MFKKYFKWLLLTLLVIFIIFLSAKPWQWITSNAAEQPTTTIQIQKIWNDNENADGIRPDSVQLHILQNNKIWKNVTLTKNDNWQMRINDVPLTDASGNTYRYSVEEITPNGYTSDVLKIWDERSYSLITWVDGYSGKTIKTEIVNSDITTEDINKLNPDNPSREGYIFTGWSDSTMDTNGNYTISAQWEIKHPDNATITINFVDEGGNILKNKVYQIPWGNDYDVIDDIQELPEGYEHHGYLDGDVAWGIADGNKTITVPIRIIVDPLTVDKTSVFNQSTASIDYTVTVTNTSGGNAYGLTITDTMINESSPNLKYSFKDFKVNGRSVTPISGGTNDLIHEIQMLDDSILFPNGETITLTYTVNVINTSTGSSTMRISNKALATTHYNDPENPDDDYLIYSTQLMDLSENDMSSESYGSDIDFLSSGTGDVMEFVVTNTHTPVSRISVTAAADWNDSNNTDNIRPDSVMVDILRDETVLKTVELNENNNWTYTLTKMPERNPETNAKYTYSVRETNVPNGYTASVNGLTVSYTHIPAHTPVTFTAVWDDCNNVDAIRPDSVTLKILQDGKIFDSMTLSKENNWVKEYTDLEGGYTLEPVDVPKGYIVSVNDFIITFTHEPSSKFTMTVEMTWDDENDVDNLRPESVTLNLLQDKKFYKEVTVTAENGWKILLSDLPKTDKYGHSYEYTVESDAPEGYTSKIDGNTVTYVHEPKEPEKTELTNITITATWDDEENIDKIRPKNIDVLFYRNSEAFDRITLNDENNWTYVYEDLPVYDKNGKRCSYTIDKTDVPDGYTTTIDGYKIINRHTPKEPASEPELTDITVNITWDDENNKDKIRPEMTEVVIYRNGKEFDKIKLDNKHNWSYLYNGLNVYDMNGNRYVYTISMSNVPESYESSVDGYRITNKHEVKKSEITEPEFTEFVITIEWDDNNNKDNIRPDNVKVIVYRNGEDIGKILITSGNKWVYTCKNLLKYDKNGKEYVYTTKEVEIPAGYEASVNGHKIINKRVPEETQKPENKTKPAETTTKQNAKPIVKSTDIVKSNTNSAAKPVETSTSEESKTQTEIVKTGQNTYPVIGLLGLTLLSGIGYFIMKKSKKRFI